MQDRNRTKGVARNFLQYGRSYYRDPSSNPQISFLLHVVQSSRICILPRIAQGRMALITSTFLTAELQVSYVPDCGALIPAVVRSPLITYYHCCLYQFRAYHTSYEPGIRVHARLQDVCTLLHTELLGLWYTRGTLA